MSANERVVRNLSTEVKGSPVPSSDSKDGGDHRHPHSVDERTRRFVKIDNDIEALRILRAVEEIVLEAYRMLQGAYGGIYQLRYVDADPELVEMSVILQMDMNKIGKNLRLIHDDVAQKIAERRDQVKESLVNEENPAPEKARGLNPYM